MKLLALHGHTQNGAEMHRQLAAVRAALPTLEVVAPDAPFACSDAAVDRLYALWGAERQAPPHFSWWDASDDGRTYAGWEVTRDRVRSLLSDGPIGVLGLSQGAILAAALAAMAEHGEAPALAFVVLVAGRKPRADVLQPFLTRPISVPSLHVWGEQDPLVRDLPVALVESFAPSTREVLTWPGGHSVPTTEAASQAIVAFLARNGPL